MGTCFFLTQTAEHQAVADGKEDIVHAGIEGDAVVQLMECTGFALAAKLASLVGRVVVIFYHTPVPQHVVQQQESAGLHLG